MEINFTRDEIEERDIEVAAQPGRDDLGVYMYWLLVKRSRKKCLRVVVLSSSSQSG